MPKISELGSVPSIDGTEIVPVVKDGTTYSSSVSNFVSSVRRTANITATGAESNIFPQPAITTSIDNIDMWINGVKLIRTTAFTSDGTNVTVIAPTVIANDDVEIITWE